MITLRCTKRLREFLDVVPADTGANNRRVLGSMNEIAFHYQVEAECAANGPLSLSDTELKFSGIPHSPIGYRLPRELVRELLLDSGRAGTV